MIPNLYFIHAQTPIHCGTGQAIGGIDLPIAREKPTSIPLVPGSSLKGVLRAASGDAKDSLARDVFGPETENAAECAGGVQFSDANLAFLPVRSLRGTFAWVTSPYILRRLVRDAKEAGMDLPAFPSDGKRTEALITGEALRAGDKVIFEDLDFEAKKHSQLLPFATKLAELLFPDPMDRDFFVERTCLVHDDVMALLLQTCTEITARNRLDNETKTVAPGALWTEESLPVESILSGLLVATPAARKGGTPRKGTELLSYVSDLTDKGLLQVGGKATVGRGLCRMRVVK